MRVLAYDPLKRSTEVVCVKKEIKLSFECARLAVQTYNANTRGNCVVTLPPAFSLCQIGVARMARRNSYIAADFAFIFRLSPLKVKLPTLEGDGSHRYLPDFRNWLASRESFDFKTALAIAADD